MPTMHTKRLCVNDVMTRDPVCVNPSDGLVEIARVLDDNSISGAPVVNGQGRVIGVVSKTDVLHRCLEGPVGSRPGSFFARLAEGLARNSSLDPEDLGMAEDVMSDEIITATPDEAVGTVARRLADAGVHRAIVVNDSMGLVGIVTSLDLLRAYPT